MFFRLLVYIATQLVGIVFEWRLALLDAFAMAKAVFFPAQITSLKAPGTGPVAIVATRGGKLPPSVHALIHGFVRCGVDVVVVANGRAPELDPHVREKLLAIIQRPNTGRDFGAYKSGVTYLSGINVQPARLFLCNDSFFVLEERLDTVIRGHLETHSDFFGVTENYRPVPHLSSYFLSFSRPVLVSKAWQDYWRSYTPWSSRPHCIHAGELGLNRTIASAGFPPVPQLPFRLLPMGSARTTALGEAPETFQAMLACLPTELKNLALDDLIESQRQASAPHPFAPFMAVGPSSDTQAGSRATERLSVKTWAKILSVCEERSQIHWAGGLFVLLHGSAFLKKDIVYRQVYSLSDALKMFETIEGVDIALVEGELRERGLPVMGWSVRRLLYNLGYV